MEPGDVSIVVANCKELERSFHYMQIIERLKGQIESAYTANLLGAQHSANLLFISQRHSRLL